MFTCAFFSIWQERQYIYDTLNLNTYRHSGMHGVCIWPSKRPGQLLYRWIGTKSAGMKSDRLELIFKTINRQAWWSC